MNRLREWSTEITVVIALVAGLAYMHGQHDSIRAEMRAGFSELRAEMRGEHAEIRAEMRDEHAHMRGEHAEMRAEMRDEHAHMRGEHAEMRDQLNSIDRRTSRIEGHLFGVEIVPEPADGE